VAVPPRKPALHVECPACHWTKATLAYENTWRQCFFCPHCQHLWDISRTPTIPAMTLSQRIVRRRARPGVALA